MIDAQTDSSERNPVEELAEEFADRLRRGERPTVEEYAMRHPQWADQIRKLFPALVVMERARPNAELDLDDDTDRTRGEELKIERLGDYRILREVGRGGMGVVYEAEQESLGRHVALKILASHALIDARHLRRFEREARAAARLHHTNIVPVFGVGQHDGLHYYVMQFIHGQGLDEVLTELNRLRNKNTRIRADDSDSKCTEPPDGQSPLPVSSNVSATDLVEALLSGEFAAHNTSNVNLDSSRLPLRSLERLQSASDVTAEQWQFQAARRSTTTGLSGTPTLSDSSARLPGQSETATLSESGRHYWQSVARIGLQVADALVYATNQGILHRDIKPSNLLLDTHGTVWVTDFGLAKATDSEDLTRTGDIVGTLRYMAPERFSGLSDIRSDIYGLGLTLYELLTLRPAFDESSRHQLFKQLIAEDPPRPRKFNLAIPRDLETIVLKAIAREPSRRYQTADELSEDLKRFLDDRPIRARPLGRVGQFWRWCRRNPALSLMTGLAAALVLAVTIGSSVMLMRLNHEHTQTVFQLARAEKAEKDGQENLRESYLAQARARRWSGQPGQRFDSLDVLKKAAAIRPGLDLRNEAVACMALVDLRITKQWQGRPARQEDWSVAFDDGLEVYARSDDRTGTISVRRVLDDVELLQLPSPKPDAWAPQLQFSTDGRFLIAGYYNYGAQLWDLRTGKAVLQCPNPPAGNQTLLEFTPDGRQVAEIQYEGSVRFYDLKSCSEQRRIQIQSGVIHARFDPTEKKLAVARPRSVQIIDTDSGDVIRDLSHPGGVESIAWHPNGKFLVAASGTKLYIWNTLTGNQFALLEGHQDSVRRCIFNYGGDLLASYGWDGVTRLWDPVTGKQLVRLPGCIQRFSRDDRGLAYAQLGSEVGLCEVETARECRTLYSYGQRGNADNIAISPCGRFLASSNWQDPTRLWDLGTGKEIASLPFCEPMSFVPHMDTMVACWNHVAVRWPMVLDSPENKLRIAPPEVVPIRLAANEKGICLSPDCRWLLATADRNEVVMFDFAKPTERIRLGSHSGVMWGAISSDNRWAVTCTQHGWGIKVWEISTGKLVKDIPAGNYSEASFSPDARWLVTTSLTNQRQTWIVGTWQEIPYEKRHGGGVFSPDGRLLAMTHRAGSMVFRQGLELVDTMTGRQLVTLTAADQLPVGQMAFTPDGSQLAVGTTGSGIRLWDLVAIRRQLAEMNLDWKLPEESKLAFTVGRSREPEKKYNASSDSSHARQAGVERSPTTSLQLVGSRGEFEIDCLEGHTNSVEAVAFSPDGALLASASLDRTIKVWDWPGGRLRHTLRKHTGDVLFVSFSPDGKTIASAARDRKVILWNAVTGELRGILDDHSSAVNSALFSVDGTRLITACDDGIVRIRNADSGTVQVELHSKEAVAALAVSPDNKTLASGGGDWNDFDSSGEVKLWDLETGERRLTIPGTFGGIWGIAYSTDAKTLAGACLDGTVRLWDPDSGREKRVLRQHLDRAIWVAFTPDGQTIASSSTDRTARLWNAATGEEVSILLGHEAGLQRLALSPDGKTLATAGDDRTVRLWRLFPTTGAERMTKD